MKARTLTCITVCFAALAFPAAAFGQAPTVASVVNSESYGPQLCPGVVAIVYGSNFGTNAANTSVSIGGKAAYVFSPVLANQMDVLIPFESALGATTLTVTVGAVASAAFPVNLLAVAPSFVPVSGAGSGLAAVYENATGGALVTLTAPAKPGDALFATAVGLGATNPATPTSTTGVTAATAPTAATPTLTVGGVNATVSFAGVLQGVASGIYVVYFVVPAGVQGTVPLVISIDGVSSSSSVTIATPGLSYIESNASFAGSGTASPGSIVSLFGNSLGATSNVVSGIFPATTAEGVQVTFNGTAAPLFHVIGAPSSGNPQQIDLLVPTNLPTSGTVNVQVTTSTAFYPNYSLTMVPSNPGIYRLADPKVPKLINAIAQFAGTAWLVLPVSTTANLGLPACSSSLSNLSVCGRPATIGDTIVIYATGLGLTTPNGNPNGTPLATGAIPPIDGSVLYETPTTPVVTIGGVPATVLFSGLVPGYPGEYQIDVTVPSGVASGDSVPVALSILGASDTSTTLSIQPRPSN